MKRSDTIRALVASLEACRETAVAADLALAAYLIDLAHADASKSLAATLYEEPFVRKTSPHGRN